MKKRKPPVVKKRWLCPFDEYRGSDKITMAKPHIFSDHWLSGTDVHKWLTTLRTFQCAPAVCLRGRKWRVHINAGTNIWEESENLHSAFRKAFKRWRKGEMRTSKDTRVALYAREHEVDGGKWRTAEWRIL